MDTDRVIHDSHAEATALKAEPGADLLTGGVNLAALTDLGLIDDYHVALRVVRDGLWPPLTWPPRLGSGAGEGLLGK
jgi:hypothetical protein